ncbi:Protein vip1 [Saitoella coloradoensis]
MSSITASNLSSDVTEKQIREFFSFCGRINSLDIQESEGTQTVVITFANPAAARTALLLHEAQLGTNKVYIKSSDGETTTITPENLPGPEVAATDAHTTDVAQEDKPKATILAEYLSHGYVVSDVALQKGLEIDQKQGISNRFQSFLNTALDNLKSTATQIDSKLHVTDKATEIDAKYAISSTATNTATQAQGLFSRYFEKANHHPLGAKVRSFYDTTSKQVLDIHTEARRLADLRKEQGEGRVYQEKLDAAEKRVQDAVAQAHAGVANVASTINAGASKVSAGQTPTTAGVPSAPAEPSSALGAPAPSAPAQQLL